MRTGAGSLRTRVTVAVIVVLAIVLLTLGITVQAVFVAQSERSLEATLASRVQLGRQLARAGLGPQQIVNRLNVEIGKVVNAPDMVAKLAALSVEPAPPATPDELKKLVNEEVEKWQDVVKARGIKPEF